VIHRVRLPILALGLSIAGLGALAAESADKPLEVKVPGVSLRASNWNDVVVSNEQGTPLITFTGFMIKWRPELASSSGSLRQTTNAQGTPAIEVVYQFPPTEKGERLEVTGKFALRPNCVDVHYRITGVPEGSDIGGCMFGRRLPEGANRLPVVKLGLWKRHEHGGIPVEHADGRFLPFRVNDSLFVLAFDAQNKLTPQWSDGSYQHTGVTQTAPGVYESSFSILFPPHEWPFEAGAAAWHDRPVALQIATGRPYNWWESKDAPMGLKATLVNTTQAPRSVQWSYWVRNFAGETVSEATREINLPAGQSVVEDIQFTPSTDRDIFFAEVSAVDKESGQEVFARANLILLPPHAFKSTPADSVIGLSGEVWPYPSKRDMQRLLDRLGVRWLRQTSPEHYANVIANRHDNVDLKTTHAPEERDKMIREILQHCIDDGNPAWEFANESNYASLNIGLGKHPGRRGAHPRHCHLYGMVARHPSHSVRNGTQGQDH